MKNLTKELKTAKLEMLERLMKQFGNLKIDIDNYNNIIINNNKFIKTHEYGLEPIHASVKSFYGKAKILEYKGLINNKECILKCLLSYDTITNILIDNYKINLYEGYYSQTTSRHQKEFLLQYNDYRTIDDIKSEIQYYK